MERKLFIWTLQSNCFRTYWRVLHQLQYQPRYSRAKHTMIIIPQVSHFSSQFHLNRHGDISTHNVVAWALWCRISPAPQQFVDQSFPLLGLCVGNPLRGIDRLPTMWETCAWYNVMFQNGLRLMQTARWHHQIETFCMLLAICAGYSSVTDEFPARILWRRALMFSLICAWINGWVNYREAGDLGLHLAHYDVIVMVYKYIPWGFGKL